ILVTATGEAKLLDFGIAKLLAPDAEGAEPTAFQSRLLTPGYAAPEQVDGRPVTTATDVFGLGRVLERLLAGHAVDADLANIRGRALHPEPDRRYADARALAEDLERWIAGRPVLATPDSWFYRLRMATRRHRAAIGAALLVAAVTAAGVTVSLFQARRASREAANAAAINRFLTDLFEAHDPDAAGGEDPPASELFRRGAAKARTELAGEPVLQAELLHTIGRIQVERGLYADADASLQEALRLELARTGESGLAAARVRDTLGTLRMHQGELKTGITLKRQALAAFERERPPGDPERLEVAVGLAEMLGVEELYAEARDLSRSILASASRAGGAADASYASAHQTLGIALQGLGDLPAAAEALRRAIEIERARSAQRGTDLAIFLNDYGLILLELPDYAAAEAVFAESLALKRKLLGEKHVQVINALINLGFALDYQGRREEGLAKQQEALKIARELFEPPHPELLETIGATAIALRRAGRWSEALPLFEETLRLSRSFPAADRPSSYTGHLAQYGALLLDLDRPADAESALREAIALYRGIEGHGGHRIDVARARRGVALGALGRWPEAAAEFEASLPALADSPQGWGLPEFALWQVRAGEAFLACGRRGDALRTIQAVRERWAHQPGERQENLEAELARVEALAAPSR
ncbi:MAG: tetratricopeptide repeat-containing protein kinase family protein, partial [Thermoanaerobaculia bacterium]